MAIKLGKNGGAPPQGQDVISATYTEECEVVDVSNRDNVGGSPDAPGYRAFQPGFKTKMWEIECHNASGLIGSLEANTPGAFAVMSVSENMSIDGAVTFTVSLREM